MSSVLALAGVMLGLYLARLHPAWAPSSIAAASLFIIYRFKLKGLAVFVATLAIGFSASFLDDLALSEDAVHRGVVIAGKENYFLFYSGGRKFYVAEEENRREIGDILLIDGVVEETSFARYESRFDFKTYLEDQGVNWELKVRTIDVVFANPLRLNERKADFLANFDEGTSDLIDALLFSRKNYDSPTIVAADSLNLIFLFAMSGIYLRTMMAMVEYLLRLRLSDKVSRIITFLFFAPFFLISIERVAANRVAVCYSARIINDRFLKKRKHSYLTILSIVALFFLLVDYHLAYQMAFLLGFGLSFLVTSSRAAFRCFKERKRRFLTPLAIFAFMVPIHISLTYEVHVMQFIFQAFAIPINSLFSTMAFLSFYLTPMVGLMSFLGRGLTAFYTGISQFDVTIAIGEIHAIFPLVYYSLYFYGLFLLESRRFAHARLVSLSLVSFVLMASFPIGNKLLCAVHFINVGQGDAILIQNRGTNVLIDTGGNSGFDIAQKVLIPFFKKQRVYALDLLITTHDDFDHDGGVTSLMENFPVRTFADDPSFFPIAIGGMKLDNLNIWNYDDENDRSLVLRFALLGSKWLLMGDASTAIEGEMIKAYPDLDIDYLKIGHHGSYTSTSASFIRSTTPREAIISVGSNNYYGHPHKSVLETLIDCGVIVRRTDLEGTISYKRYSF